MFYEFTTGRKSFCIGNAHVQRGDARSARNVRPRQIACASTELNARLYRAHRSQDIHVSNTRSAVRRFGREPVRTGGKIRIEGAQQRAEESRKNSPRLERTGSTYERINILSHSASSFTNNSIRPRINCCAVQTPPAPDPLESVCASLTNTTQRNTL